MHKKLIVSWAIVSICLLNGCATVNFSANYYAPLFNYKTEVKKLFEELNSRLPLKYDYTMALITEGHQGIPHLVGKTIKLPDNFVKYVYQNYYQDRFKILTSVIAHEMCHSEYDLPDTPPEVHFKTDHRAILLLKDNTTVSPGDYYQSLSVLSNYWNARKGVGGHAANVAWNVANVGTLVFFGAGYLKDWFATDISIRKGGLLNQEYGRMITSNTCFKRTESPKTVNSEIPSFDTIFLRQKTPEITENNYPKKIKISDQQAEKQVDRFKGKTKKEVEAILGKPISKRRVGTGILQQYKIQEGNITIFFDEGIVSSWTKE